MEWSNDKVLQLIAEYKARPVLWDSKNWDYKNRLKKHKAWEELGQIFNISQFEIERKFKILLVQYRREKSKILKMVEAGYDLAETEANAWYAYKSFNFLRKGSRPKRILDSLDVDNTVYSNETEYEEIKIEPTSDEYEVASNENNIGNFLESRVDVPEKKRRKLLISNSMFPHSSSAKDICNQESEDIDLFASYVASEMRSLNNQQLRKKLKRKILKAILETCEEDDAT